MRRITLVLYLLACTSLLLAPFSTLHAHVDSDHHHITVHGGHVHHGDDGASVHALDHIADMHLAMVDRGLRKASGADWQPLIREFTFKEPLRPYSTAVFRPPADDSPVSLRSYLQPPLRGPPSRCI